MSNRNYKNNHVSRAIMLQARLVFFEKSCCICIFKIYSGSNFINSIQFISICPCPLCGEFRCSPCLHCAHAYDGPPWSIYAPSNYFGKQIKMSVRFNENACSVARHRPRGSGERWKRRKKNCIVPDKAKKKKEKEKRIGGKSKWNKTISRVGEINHPDKIESERKVLFIFYVLCIIIGVSENVLPSSILLYTRNTFILYYFSIWPVEFNVYSHLLRNIFENCVVAV